MAARVLVAASLVAGSAAAAEPAEPAEALASERDPVPWRVRGVDPIPTLSWQDDDGRPLGLSIGGYVRGLLRSVDRESNAIDAASDGEEVTDFSAEADLDLEATLPLGVSLVLEIAFDDEEGFDELEQAYARWDVGAWVLRAGRFHQWFGWERYDAPELWRVNPSYTYYNSGNVTGASAWWYADEARSWRLEGYVVDEVVTPLVAAPTKGSRDLGYGAALRYEPDADLLVKLDGYYDVDTAPSLIDDDGRGDVWTVSANAEWARCFDLPLELSLDLAYGDNPNGDQQFVLSAARWFWTDGLATTLMVNYLDENYEEDAIAASGSLGRPLRDNERTELSLTVQWWPLDRPDFRVAAEARYVDSSIPDEDEWGVFLEVTAVAQAYRYPR